MNVRYHRGFGHGLQPGTDHDINCGSCQREGVAGQTPVITGTDDRPLRQLGPDTAPRCRNHLQFRSDCERCVAERQAS